MLSPLFIAGRIRTAIPLINNVTKTLLEYIEGGPESATMEFDVKNVRENDEIVQQPEFIFSLFSCQRNSQLMCVLKFFT